MGVINQDFLLFKNKQAQQSLIFLMNDIMELHLKFTPISSV